MYFVEGAVYELELKLLGGWQELKNNSDDWSGHQLVVLHFCLNLIIIIRRSLTDSRSVPVM